MCIKIQPISFEDFIDLIDRDLLHEYNEYCGYIDIFTIDKQRFILKINDIETQEDASLLVFMLLMRRFTVMLPIIPEKFRTFELCVTTCSKPFDYLINEKHIPPK